MPRDFCAGVPTCTLCRRELVPLFTTVDARGDETWAWCVHCDGLGYDPGLVPHVS